ncbi:MAG: fatty acyl-AMP ligase, partial [Bradymonadaceae bacterium]
MVVPLEDGVSNKTLVDVLHSSALDEPDRRIFRYLDDGETEGQTVTYQDLLDGSRAVAAELRRETQPGDRVLLLYEPGVEYIEAFFGCLYAGRIAVPVYPPDPNGLEQTLPRLVHIIEDAQPSAVATTSKIRSMASGLMSADTVGGNDLAWCATDGAEASDEQPIAQHVEPGSLAFLQYTSGSTRRPRGVRITHRNLLHNVKLIAETLELDRQTVGVSWLHMYHDMGLIGKIITPAVVGCSVVLMSPRDFLRKPVRWLRAISEYGGTVSAAPNFAYDLCVRKVSDEQLQELDLSSWQVALNGAEPVRAQTLEAFVDRFEGTGFQPETFLPAYGLAESTLLVTGSQLGPKMFEVTKNSLEQGDVEFADDTQAEPSTTLVSSGTEAGFEQNVEIVDPDERTPLEHGEVGEIWVKGRSVADGYWRRPDESEQRFQARLRGERDAGQYLRTGDLGFRIDSDLVVTGRRADLMIFRGRNIYPQDVEATVAEAHDAVRPGGMAAFSIDRPGGEIPVIVAEMERRTNSAIEGDDRRQKETLPKYEVDRLPTV